MKRILLSLVACGILLGAAVPAAQAQDHHGRRHCWYRHHHRVCRQR